MSEGASQPTPIGSARKADEPARDRRPVLVLSQYYAPEPGFITEDVAHHLSAHEEVVVVCAHPNYPHGRFYPGTRWWWPQRTREGGVTVWRLPMFPDHSSSHLRRLLSYLSFTMAASLVAPFVAGRPRVVWVYHTPFFTALAALPFKLLYRARVVYSCADLWPESLRASGVAKDGPAMRLLFAFRRATNRWADQIVCSTRGILECFREEGVPESALHHVPVWVPVGTPPAEVVEPEVPTIVYAGNLGPAQSLETVIEAAGVLQRRGVRVNFDLYGTGTMETQLRALGQRLGLSNVTFRGRVSSDEAFRASSSATAQLVSLRATRLFRMTVPSKLYFCFAAATPILYGLEGEAADLARASGGAIPFNPGDAVSLADAVEGLLALTPAQRGGMRARLRQCFEQFFMPEQLKSRYEEILLRPDSAASRDATDSWAAFTGARALNSIE